jgi:hypothetical protein
MIRDHFLTSIVYNIINLVVHDQGPEKQVDYIKINPTPPLCFLKVPDAFKSLKYIRVN